MYVLDYTSLQIYLCLPSRGMHATSLDYCWSLNVLTTCCSMLGQTFSRCYHVGTKYHYDVRKTQKKYYMKEQLNIQISQGSVATDLRLGGRVDTLSVFCSLQCIYTCTS